MNAPRVAPEFQMPAAEDFTRFPRKTQRGPTFAVRFPRAAAAIFLSRCAGDAAPG
jgi:hypothetical protein